MARGKLVPFFIAGVWVNASEFLRNQLLLRNYWTAHFEGLGNPFPSEPVNAAVWGVWGFVYAGMVLVLSGRFGFLRAVAVSWFAGFVLMWLAMWNLTVLPWGILPYAVPLSLLETAGAVFICRRFSPVTF